MGLFSVQRKLRWAMTWCPAAGPLCWSGSLCTQPSSCVSSPRQPGGPWLPPSPFHELFPPVSRNTPCIELAVVWLEIVQVGWINQNINKKPKVQQNNNNKNSPVSWALKNVSSLSSDTVVYAHFHLSHGCQSCTASLQLLFLKRNMRQVLFFEKKDRADFVWIHKT